jgi:PadR family transcriptional regulator PadR
MAREKVRKSKTTPEYIRGFLKGSTDILLLSLLRQETMYGYQIIQELTRRTGEYFSFKEGTLYPALHRLEGEELVESHWEITPQMKRPRRYYRITEAGQHFLTEKLSEWQRFANAVSSVVSQPMGLVTT